MLTCYRTRRRLDAFLDGALAERAARSASAHLATCTGCQHEADQLRRLQGLLRSAASTPEPADWAGFWPGIVRGIEAGARREARTLKWRVRGHPWRSGPRLAYGGALAAALGLYLIIWQLTGSVTPEAASVVISSAHTEQPGSTVMVYTPHEKDLTVVWVFDDN